MGIANVEPAILEFDGVSRAEANLEAKSVTVEFDENRQKTTDIKQAVENSGQYELII